MINSFKSYLVEEEKSIYFTFGRMNPPTIGHEKLMDKTRGANRNYRVYASQSQDPRKNPLNFRNKVISLIEKPKKLDNQNLALLKQ